MKPKKGIFRKVLWRLGLAGRRDFVAIAEQLAAQQQVGRRLSQSLTAMRQECDDVFAPLVEKAIRMHVKGGRKDDMSIEMVVDKQFIAKALAGRDQMAAVGHLCHWAGGRMGRMLMKELIDQDRKGSETSAANMN